MKRIPKNFKLFSTTINVLWDNNSLNRRGAYGTHDYSSCEILLSKTDGVVKLSKDRIMDTFYHEKVHSILEAMNKQSLSEDEEFVDVFAKLLRQSDETSEY